MSKRKILLINNGYPSKENIHYVSYIKTIKDCLELSSFDVELLVMSSSFNNSFKKVLNYFHYYLLLLFKINYKKYDFVYINNYPHSFLPLIIHFFWMKNIIIHWHGDDISPTGIFNKILNKVSYRFIPSKVFHLSPSHYFAKKIAEVLKIPIDDIFVTPSGGVDTQNFKPIKRNINVNRDTFKLGFSSHLSFDKGIDYVIKFMKSTKNLNLNNSLVIELHYIKYGSESEKYSNTLKDIPNTIEHSMYKKEEMPNFYNSIDLLLFPTRRDSLGSVGLEAMACGIPILGTNDFALKEYVIPGVNGELFKKNDYESFKSNLIKCIHNNGYTPRETVLKSYSKNSVISNYIKILNGYN